LLTAAIFLPLTFVSGARAQDADVQEKVACAQAAESGQEHRRAGKLRDALKQFRRCARQTCPNVITTDCLRFVSETEDALPSIVFRAREGGKDVTDVTVYVNGEEVTRSLDGRAYPMDPGRHEVRFEREGSPDVEQEVVLVEGEKSRALTVTFGGEAPEAAAGPPLATWVLAGVGLASVAGFAYFGMSARADRADLEDTCGRTRTCTDEQIAGFRNKAVTADVFLGVGIASFAVAGLLWANAGSDKEPEPSPELGLTVHPKGAMIRWLGAF
jgi:hypothetical protein